MRGVMVISFLATACGSAARAPAAKTANGFVDGPSGVLRVDDGGDGGVPVVFVHGLGSDHHVWDEVLAHVRTTRRAVALDTHGSGESAPSPTSDYSVDAMVDDVEAVLGAEHLERVILVGHSFGGNVVEAFAARHPEQVAGVVLVDPTADFSSLPADQRDGIERAFNEHRAETVGDMLTGSAPGVDERVMKTLDATNDAAFRATLHGALSWDPKPVLAAYDGPRIAIISGFMDGFPLSIHHVVEIDAHVIAGTSHFLMLDQPDEFDRLLDEFLASVE